MKYKVLFGMCLLALGCSDASSSKSGESLSKAEFHAMAKADGVGPGEVCIALYGVECDLCAEQGWYGDGICDSFCALPDDDCSGDVDAGPAYDPCEGLSCGDTCTLCDPNDPGCFETQEVKYCDEHGSCQSQGLPYCDDAIGPDAGTDAGPAPFDPCQGLSCGDQCSLCDPSVPDCVEPAVYLQCSSSGECTVPTECTLSYEPCAGKSCGDGCTLCDPADPDCVETAVDKACDASGHCSAAIPQCSQP